MKTFIKFIILLVIINIVCWYLLPFMVYLTECMIRDAPFIWLTMSTLLVIIGIISFIYSYINGKSKNNSISESDCDNITDYVEKYIGAIITKYDWYDEPMRHSSKEETVLQDVSSTEYSKDSELSEHKNERYNEYDSKPKNKHNSSSSSYTPEYGTRDIWVNCINCNGSGYCPSCHGKGQCVSTWSDGSYNDTYQCPVCMGSGRCQQCYGTRGHYEKQIYQIK